MSFYRPFLPQVLVLTLKRFSAHTHPSPSGPSGPHHPSNLLSLLAATTLGRDKIHTLVDFPLYGLDLSTFCHEYATAGGTAASSTSSQQPAQQHSDSTGKSSTNNGSHSNSPRYWDTSSTSTSSSSSSDVSVSAIPALYDLFGIINHYGRMGFGHYTSYVRNWDESRNELSADWFECDDETVRRVSRRVREKERERERERRGGEGEEERMHRERREREEEEEEEYGTMLKTSSAYILFYRRR